MYQSAISENYGNHQYSAMNQLISYLQKKREKKIWFNKIINKLYTAMHKYMYTHNPCIHIHGNNNIYLKSDGNKIFNPNTDRWETFSENS